MTGLEFYLYDVSHGKRLCHASSDRQLPLGFHWEFCHILCLHICQGDTKMSPDLDGQHARRIWT